MESSGRGLARGAPVVCPLQEVLLFQEVMVLLGLASLPYYLERSTIIWQHEEEALVKANKTC